MPSPTNTATARTRPEQPLGTVHPQTSPGPGPIDDPAPEPHTPPDASTRGRQPAACQPAATQANPEPHRHHSPPVWPTEGPTHVPSEGPPTQTCAATLTDATSARPERPLGTIRPHAHDPTGSPSPQAPATPSTSAPGYHPPAPAQAEPASQQRYNPQAGPAARRTETPSGNRPAPNPDPNPDPTHAAVPADAPRANAPGRELPTGVPHPEGGTPETRLAAAEGGEQAERARNHTRPISRPKPNPNHEHHKQPAKEGQHHNPCPNTPTQDPSQD